MVFIIKLIPSNYNFKLIDQIKFNSVVEFNIKKEKLNSTQYFILMRWIISLSK